MKRPIAFFLGILAILIPIGSIFIPNFGVYTFHNGDSSLFSGISYFGGIVSYNDTISLSHFPSDYLIFRQISLYI